MMSSIIHTVPPLVPPPAWNNKPLPCAPMITGHNCFGAVLYPITMADFVIADVTDAMMEGYISGFPNTYATKVGKTGDAMYKGRVDELCSHGKMLVLGLHSLLLSIHE